jgi:dUTP pyrophosphatase
MEMKVKRFDKKLPLPKCEKGAAGFDFYCRTNVTFNPGEMKAIPSNNACEVPNGYALLVVPRSSTAKRFGLVMPHSIGVVDPFYCGDNNEVVLLFMNFTNKKVHIKKGDRLAQGLLIKCENLKFKEVKKLKKSTRPTWSIDNKNSLKKYDSRH